MRKNTREHGDWASNTGWSPTRQLLLGGRSPEAEGWLGGATLNGKG